MEKMRPYFRRLKQALDCPAKNKAAFLADAQRMAEDFMQGSPDATAEDVEHFLGAPGELAQTYLDSLEPGLLARYQARKKRTRLTLIALTAVAFLLMGTWVVRLRNRPIQAEITDTLIIYESEESK